MFTGILNKDGFTKKINIFCLLTAIALILILPLKKEIWYDETVSILCSKGISHDSPLLFADTNAVSSATLQQLNTDKNVFDATVTDNANSFLYNIGLHWFALLFGNSVSAYMLFSKLLAIATLIAFYFLCDLFFKNNLFTSVAILLLATDINFLGMSHEIRAYAMGIFFVTLAAIYFYKFMYGSAKPFYLFCTGLCAVAAVLSHFLSVYIILVLLMVMIVTKKSKLFSAKNILAVVIPVALIAVFFYFAYPGLETMSRQNHAIQQKALSTGFSLQEVCWRALKFTAINFKVVFPSFRNTKPVILISFLFVMALYLAGIKASGNKEQKRNLHLLFWLGAGGSLFLAVLCVRSHHYTALYYRYFSFCLPFCSLFIAYLLFVFFNNEKINKPLKYCLFVVLVAPSLLLLFTSLKNARPRLSYNHIAIARTIESNNITKIEVPQWRDALLINSFLPQGYKIDYFRNPLTTGFTLYNAGGEEKIPVIRKDE